MDTHSIGDQLEEALKQLTPNQLRFIAAMQEHGTRQEAAQAIGLTPAAIKKWPPIVDQAIDLMARDRVEAAREASRAYAESARKLLAGYLVEAMQIKVAGLRSQNEPLRQRIASEIIEWVLSRETTIPNLIDNKTDRQHQLTLARLREIITTRPT